MRKRYLAQRGILYGKTDGDAWLGERCGHVFP